MDSREPRPPSGDRRLLQSTEQPSCFLEVLFAYREQGKYCLHEFVVMPNHFHVLITVGPDMSIERAVQLIKGGFAFRATHELGFAAPVWQKGFSELRVLETEAFSRQVDQAEDYLYLSAGERFQLDAPPQRLKPCLFHVLSGTPEGVP
jgi:REP-associated tyrosine transposase